jgi:uncharacterized protein (TIGR03437 family)
MDLCLARWLGPGRRLFVIASLAVLCAAGLPCFSQTASPSRKQPSSAWDDWFYSQRRYGMGYIPDGALPKAVAQRNAMRQGNYHPAADSTPAGASSWVSLGPSVVNSPTRGLISGRITSLAIDPANSSTVYVAAAGGGVWKTTNRGARWDPITDNLPSLASGAVAVDPFSREVWYGTGELDFCRDCYYGAGVYRSADGGADWSRVAADTFLSSPTSVIVFDPRNQGTVFIGRSSALWKSSDDGQSWHATLTGVITDFVFNPVDSTIAYAAAGNAFGDPQNGVYRSTDGGQTWTRLAGGLPAQATMGRIALAVDPNAPSTVYALIAKSSDFTLNGLYRSRDGGNTWTILGSLPPDVFLEAQFPVGLYNMVVRVDPRNPAAIYVGSSDLWKSSDGGSSWQNLHIAEGQHNVVFDPSDPQTFYLINDSGVWKSSDGGQSFADLNNTLAIAQFQSIGLHPSNPNLAVGATQDNGTNLYAGGFAWDQGRLGDSGAAFYESSNPQTIYASGHYFDLFRSDDGGKTWPLLAQSIDPTDRVQFYPPFLPTPGQPGSLFFGTQRLWWSGDQGNHWVALAGDLTGGGSATITALGIGPISSQVIYAGTSDARVQVSGDGGRSWSPASPLPNRFITSIAVHPQISQRAFVALSGFGSGHVFRTDDRGGSWQDISANLPDIPVNAILIDALSPDTVYVGTDIGVFVLAPDGSWTPLNQGIPNVIVLGLSQNPATGLLVAATHGRGAFALVPSGLAGTAPHLDSVVNSASFAPGPLAPGMAASLFGWNLSTAAVFPTFPFPLPVSLIGTTVTVNGIPAPLYSASPSQVNFQVPYGITGPLAVLTVLNASGQATVQVSRVDASPGIFQNGGIGNFSHADGSLVTDLAPAHSGEQVALYASGLGAVDQVVAGGQPSPSNPPARTLSLPAVTVGSIPVNVTFSGLSPGWIGVYQVNFVVPAGLSGKVPVVLNISGAASNVVTMSVGP